ncbi:uroporphyrinogen-III synthase [Metabacillus endolithicus]|uniref:Uroporphyrinogen-III synthase n=1 Tax=Metabacillus endolithicus TaxID=1535204 RepID=A0ABW5C065_9BACI|nr:uroporphyrinogen-III synthase [Metabacillus endolithicus]UPG65761.1 uroporphyrinogen-III synthase [Metabacillus endolithicus]
MKRLTGKTIALAGQRKSEELSKLVENLGGAALIRPAQGTVFLDDTNVEKEIKALIDGNFNWLIFTTGIGTDKLYQTAVNMGLGDRFIEALNSAKIAARGYKTVNVLKKLGIQPDVRDDDGSTAGLVRELRAHSFSGLSVALQLHGDPAPILIEFLKEQGADYREILPYQHIPPKPEVMEQLVSEILDGKIDAVNFTSTPQARFLMAYAKEKGVEKEVLHAFSTNVMAVSVGKVTAQALREVGITRMVVPEEERMGSAIIALVNYYKQEEENK